MRLIVDQSGCARIENQIDCAVFYQNTPSDLVKCKSLKTYVNREVMLLALRSPSFINIDVAEEEAFLLAVILERIITKLRREIHQTDGYRINVGLKRQRYLATSLLLRLKQHPRLVDAKLNREKDVY